ncbi:EAL domain-containing protein [Paraburkholderia sp.]|uniref:sensor domain-containing protein n=1 Tax=Paraburkholderia sp. TaxID=1926495 RepID=UPI002395D6CC|nr:EAL domain-containing protein [Paraburkholderia sp.]MDE1179582.1 EAL domain-containing protein [Paraburkholderia sp.]
MNYSPSKRLLMNAAVVAVAIGANAFVAYMQIDSQRVGVARMLQSTAVQQKLDAYRLTLERGVSTVGRVGASGHPAPAGTAVQLGASLQTLDHALRDAWRDNPQMSADFADVSADSAAIQRGIEGALTVPGANDPTAPDAPNEAARAAAATAYTELGMNLAIVENELATLRTNEREAVQASLMQSVQETRRATLLLVVTMLLGSGLLIYTFGRRESVAREKLRLARSLRVSDERLSGLFDNHPVPIYIFDCETLRFLAINAAAVQQYGYSETEFLAMTIRAIRPHAEIGRLESHLQRSGIAPRHGQQTAGVWQHRRKDGSTVRAEISYHALSFNGRAAYFVLAADVTDQINAEAEAQRSNQMLETVIDNIPQRIFWKDRESRYLGCNMAFARDAGLAYPEQVVGKTDDELPWHALADDVRLIDREVIESGVPRMNYEFDMVIDGVHRTSVTSKLPFTDSDGRVIGVLGSYTDITERKRADLALRLQSRALDSSVNAILITGPTPTGNLIEYVNPAFKRITGYDPAEVIGQDCRLLQRDDHDQEGIAAIRQALLANREVSAVLRNYRKDGALFWNQLYVAPVPNAQGETTHHIGVINDVTALIRYQEQLEYQANYDSLTKLPNRNLLRDRLQHALILAARHHKGVAVVFIDLDGFKNVNDSLGHSVGDRLLTVVGDRLLRCARASDTVARHGGDEFVIVMTDTVDEQSLIAWMERVRASISEPVWLDGTELYVGCSMGASLFPQDGEDAETLMKKADLAMYRAKDMGRNTFQFFQPEMNASAGARMNLERRLRRALRDNEFLLHYQPQVDMVSGKIVGMEALVRWSDPEVGLIPPSSFIPVAEESGLIGPLSDWVLREACRQNKAWQDAGLPPARVSVNLSARQFQQRNIAQLVMEVLQETGLEPRYLELELTESTIMRNAEEAVMMLNELSALGIGIAIDDFGTGYSSLSYLKRFPVDRLKIDRSFVSDIGVSGDDETITSAIIALAHSLQLQVIAEGVETSAQLDFLRQRACDEMQGFYFAKPLPRDAIPQLLQHGVEVAVI